MSAPSAPEPVGLPALRELVEQVAREVDNVPVSVLRTLRLIVAELDALDRVVRQITEEQR